MYENLGSRFASVCHLDDNTIIWYDRADLKMKLGGTSRTL